MIYVGEAERIAMSKLGADAMFTNGSVPENNVPLNMGANYWNRKLKRPEYKVLRNDIDRLGYSGTGRKYGVSDNAVRKWLELYKKRGGSKCN